MKLCQWFIVGAVLLDGILFGAGIDRLIVQMPAWRQAGVAGWAAYSRHADLGNGLLLYPGAAIGGALLSIAGAVAYGRWRGGSPNAAIPIYGAAAFTIVGLILTTQAAPLMLSLRTIGDDTIALRYAFDGFELWGGIRGVVQALAFVCNLWSLIALRPG